MHTTTSDADGDESVTDLAHNDAPVCAPLDCSADCSQFSLPIGVYLVLVSQGTMRHSKGVSARNGVGWCDMVHSPTVTTSGSLWPKLFLRRFIEGFAAASEAAFGESGHDGGVLNARTDKGKIRSEETRLNSSHSGESRMPSSA